MCVKNAAQGAPGDEDFADPPPRADTPKLEIPQVRTGQLTSISLRLLPVLLRVRGTLWEKLATDKIGSRIIWSAAKNVTQDTLALTKDLWSKGVPASYPFGGLGQLSIPSPLRPSRNVQSSSRSTSGRFVSRSCWLVGRWPAVALALVLMKPGGKFQKSWGVNPRIKPGILGVPRKMAKCPHVRGIPTSSY